ncbi:hypothetical protein BDR07DRAFT_1494959 [Suillus spraguei]|nr:hypothetical protein BDR07DRAFT_1494959 [Suillus spraguei]
MSTCDIKIWRTWALAITHEAGHIPNKNSMQRRLEENQHIKIPVGLPADVENLFDHSNSFMTVKMQIDIARYSKLISPKNTGHNEEKEEKLLERCPPGHEGTKLVDKPATILDASGTIITWYLVKTVLKGREIRRAFGLIRTLCPFLE